MRKEHHKADPRGLSRVVDGVRNHSRFRRDRSGCATTKACKAEKGGGRHQRKNSPRKTSRVKRFLCCCLVPLNREMPPPHLERRARRVRQPCRSCGPRLESVGSAARHGYKARGGRLALLRGEKNKKQNKMKGLLLCREASAQQKLNEGKW